MNDQKLKQAEANYKVFSIVQYAAPLIFVLMAIFLPVLSDLGTMRDTIVGVLCVFALIDFVFFRFFLLPRARQNLERLQNGQN